MCAGCGHGRLAVGDTPDGPDTVRTDPDADWVEALSELPDYPAEVDHEIAKELAGATAAPPGDGLVAAPLDSSGGLPAMPSEESRGGALGDPTDVAPAVRHVRAPFVRLRIRRTSSSSSRMEAVGSDSNRPKGSPERLLGLLHLNPLPWIQAGIAAEKDPGESPKHGFASGFVRLHGLMGGAELIAGDYRIRIGPGLMFGRASFAGAGSSAFAENRAPAGPLRPHTSTDESRFLRGIAARVPVVRGSLLIDVAAFVSSVGRSGRVDSTGFFSPDLTGLFRTTSEIGRFRTNREVLGGAVVTLRRNDFRIVVSGLRTWLDHPMRIQSRAGGAGRGWASGSVEMAFSGPSLEIAGEAAFSPRTAFTLEARVFPTRTLAGVLLIQLVQPGFLGPYGVDALGRPAPGNSTSCALSCVIRPARWGRVALSAALSSTLVPRTDDPLPGLRGRYSAEAEFSMTPGWSVLLSAGLTRTEGGVTLTDQEGRALRVMRESGRSTFRIQSDVDVGGRWSLRNRCEVVMAVRAPREERERGVVLQTDLTVRPTPTVRTSFRALAFDVSGWGARVYAAEADVDGAMTVPAFSGRGVRLYALVRWMVAPTVAVSCRYGTKYQETVRTTRSPGSDQRAEECDLSLQLDAGW